MTEKKYPEEIYKVSEAEGEIHTQCVQTMLENAYDLGLEHGRPGDPLLGWSNLTTAIKAGERIDWHALDGVEAKCVHIELGTLTYKMKRNVAYRADKLSGWGMPGHLPGWGSALINAWDGEYGWSLWVKGEIPLRKLTADQLEPGATFHARYKKGAATYTYPLAQLIQVGGETHVVCFNETFTNIINRYNPDDVEVLEVYGVGTLPTPKENA